MTLDTKMPMGIAEIQQCIPHRYPFLLLDRVNEYTPGKGLVALKNVSFTDPHLQGHFPNNPVMPGVLQIEALAQASAVFGKLEVPTMTTCFLTEVSSARFRRLVVPGDTMLLTVKLEKRRSMFFWFTGEITIGSEVASQINFSAKLE
jgi:3-hydroxyacyl-[acyl-carrier-protein] dehydratase